MKEKIALEKGPERNYENVSSFPGREKVRGKTDGFEAQKMLKRRGDEEGEGAGRGEVT